MDQRVLLLINGAGSPEGDTFFWTVSQPATWIPLYLCLLAAIYWRYRQSWRQLALILLTIILAVGGTDWLVHALKYVVCRPRPSHDPALAGLIRLVHGYAGGAYGFPSNHAADTASVATMAALWLRARTAGSSPLRAMTPVLMTVLVAFVLLNCYSRLYLGVHYPLDVTVGALMGVTISIFVFWLTRRIYS